MTLEFFEQQIANVMICDSRGSLRRWPLLDLRPILAVAHGSSVLRRATVRLAWDFQPESYSRLSILFEIVLRLKHFQRYDL